MWGEAPPRKPNFQASKLPNFLISFGAGKWGAGGRMDARLLAAVLPPLSPKRGVRSPPRSYRPRAGGAPCAHARPAPTHRVLCVPLWFFVFFVIAAQREACPNFQASLERPACGSTPINLPKICGICGSNTGSPSLCSSVFLCAPLCLQNFPGHHWVLPLFLGC